MFVVKKETKKGKKKRHVRLTSESQLYSLATLTSRQKKRKNMLLIIIIVKELQQKTDLF